MPVVVMEKRTFHMETLINQKKKYTFANAVVEEHLNFAKVISRRYCKRIGFRCDEDIISSGIMGLIKASRSYFSGYTLTFESWAAFKIRSEISDYLNQYFGNRSLKGNAKKNAILVPYKETLEQDSLFDLEAQVINKERVLLLIRGLPKKWKEVIFLHYIKGYNLREIGEKFGDSKANASRIKIAALKKMKEIALKKKRR